MIIMEENKQCTSTSQKPGNNEQEIDLIEVLHRILAIRKTLYKAAGIGLIAGIIIAFSIPRHYTVSVTLSPEMSSDNKSNGFANMAASFLGTNTMNTAPDALNASMSKEIVSSTPFLLELFDSRVQTLDGKMDTTLTAYLNKQRTPWWNVVLGAPGKVIGAVKGLFAEKAEQTVTTPNPFQLTPDENRKIGMLRGSIQTLIDKKTGITTLTVTLQDPKVTAQVADSVVNKLQQYIIQYRIAKAQEDCAYLEQLYKARQQEYYDAQQRYARYVDTNKNLMMQSTLTEQERLQNDMNLAYQVYSQVAQQLQVARAKIQEEKPVFAVVEPATIPLHASNSRGIMITGILFLAVFGTLVWKLVGVPFLQQIRK